jgi:hypothetical protein
LPYLTLLKACPIYGGMNLSSRITLLVSIPFLAFLIISGMFWRADWSRYQASKAVYVNSQLFQATSALIHQTQKERARSVMFVGQGQGQEDLEKQRIETDARVEGYKAALHQAALSPEEIKNGEAALESLTAGREKVTSKSFTGAEAAKAYTNIIKEFSGVQRSIAAGTSLDSIETVLYSLTILETAKESTGRLRATLLAVLAAGKPIGSEQMTNLSGLKAGLDSNLASPALKMREENKKKLDGFKELAHWKDFNQTYLNVLDQASVGNYKDDPKAFYTSITAAIDDIAVVVDDEVIALSARATEIKSGALSDLVWLSTICCFLIVGLMITAHVSIRKITRPIDAVIARLSEASQQVGSASQMLSQSSQQLSSGTAQSAAAIEETSSSLTELTSMVSSNTDNARKAAEISGQCRENATHGAKEMTLLTGAMNEIANSSKKIEDIINVIDDIAFQTNLLALNAAVEAARAGEQGKGFAVVADAVRALAQRSAVAAKDIASLIKDSVEKIEGGRKASDRNSESLKAIVDAINNIATINGEISSACTEQSSGISQISTAVTQLDQSTQNNAASAEEAAATAEEMFRQAQLLSESVRELLMVVKGPAAGEQLQVAETSAQSTKTQKRLSVVKAA